MELKPTDCQFDTVFIFMIIIWTKSVMILHLNSRIGETIEKNEENCILFLISW